MSSPQERPVAEETKKPPQRGTKQLHTGLQGALDLDSKPEPVKLPPLRKKRRFPWLLLLVFLASVFYFWVWPQMRGDQPVEVEVTSTK